MKIEEIHLNKTGKVSDKWSSYLPYYDELFSPFKHVDVRLLEIGVQNGGSLDTWAEYFKNGVKFVGCDVDPLCANLVYEDKRINVVVGDANKPETIGEILGVSNCYDIIIDDGSHLSIDIIDSFLNYFQCLKPGGIYVVEDTHALYVREAGGGILNEVSALGLFKKLTDICNFQFWEKDLSIQTYLSSFFNQHEIPRFIVEGWIDSVQFRNSIITIHKAKTPTHRKLGKSLTRGAITEVNKNVLNPSWNARFEME